MLSSQILTIADQNKKIFPALIIQICFHNRNNHKLTPKQTNSQFEVTAISIHTFGENTEHYNNKTKPEFALFNIKVVEKKD